VWFARQGHPVTAYDFVDRGARAALLLAREEQLPLEWETLNLHEWRSVLAVGATEAHRAGPRTLVARHLADCTTRAGRDALWRLSSMALRSGGRLHLEHWVRGGGPEFPGQRPLGNGRVRAELRARGATIVHAEEYDVPASSPPGPATERKTVDHDETRTIGRVVAQWRD
jgi:hypothetical protein